MCVLHFEEIVKRGLKLNGNYWNKYNSRHRSWEYCREIFWNTYLKKKSMDKEILCLNLAFYLTSWGMYRGSSALLFNDYFVHENIIDVLFDNKSNALWNYNPFEDLTLEKLDGAGIFNKNSDIWRVYNDIHKHTNYPRKGAKSTMASETLISKVLLGTWGCVPAYDVFLKKGLAHFDLPTDFSKKGLVEVVEFLYKCSEVKRVISTYTKYTPMKIIDAYFWELGYELTLLELVDKNSKKVDYVARELFGYSENSINKDELVEKIKALIPNKYDICTCGVKY